MRGRQPAGRGGKVRHGVGEGYQTLHELPGEEHGASSHGGHHLDHLKRQTSSYQINTVADSQKWIHKAAITPQQDKSCSLKEKAYL